jgi:hypothetical protein
MTYPKTLSLLTFLNSFCLVLAGSAAFARENEKTAPKKTTAFDELSRDYYQSRIKTVNQVNREIKDSFKPSTAGGDSAKKSTSFPPTAEEIKKERELVAKEKDPSEQFEEKKPKGAGELKTPKTSMTKDESDKSEPSPLIPKSLRSDSTLKSESNRSVAPVKGGFTPTAVPDYGTSKAIPGEAAPVIAYPGNQE